MYGGVNSIQLLVTIVRVLDSHRIQIQSPLDLVQLCIFDSRARIKCVGYRHSLICVEEGFSFCCICDVMPDEEAGISFLLSRIPDFLHLVNEDRCP